MTTAELLAAAADKIEGLQGMQAMPSPEFDKECDALVVALRSAAASKQPSGTRPRHGTFDRWVGGCDCPQCSTCQNPDTSPRDY